MVAGQDRPPLFNLRLLAALIVAGIVGFAAFMVLAAYAGDFRTGRDGRAHALSVAATGFKGLVDLVGYADGKPHLIRGEQELGTEDLVIVTIDDQTDPSMVNALLDRRAAKPTLLILPKWITLPSQTRSGWVYEAGLIDPATVAGHLRAIGQAEVEQTKRSRGEAAGTSWLEDIRVPAPRSAQTISGAGIKPLLLCCEGRTLLGQLGEQPHYVLADPDLMNNHGLKDPPTARAALQILEALNSTGAKTVSFDLTTNGFGRKPNALKLLFEPPFLAFTLSLFAAALLAGLHGAFRFGPERRDERAIAFGKAALVENSAALVQQARREHRAGAAYANLIGEEAARASGAPASLRGAALDSYLDRLSASRGAKFSDLAARARAAASRAELVSAAGALFSWKKEVIG